MTPRSRSCVNFSQPMNRLSTFTCPLTGRLDVSVVLLLLPSPVVRWVKQPWHNSMAPTSAVAIYGSARQKTGAPKAAASVAVVAVVVVARIAAAVAAVAAVMIAAVVVAAKVDMAVAVAMATNAVAVAAVVMTVIVVVVAEAVPAEIATAEEIARITRGEILKTPDLDLIKEKLASLPDPEPLERRLRLWAHPVWIGAIILLLTVFWVGRKVAGVV